MTRMKAAYSELTRVLPWAMRALGYSFGVAERSAHIIAMSAAVAPDRLTWFLKPVQRPAGAATRIIDESGRIVVDAHGLSLLEVAPASIDLAASRLTSGNIVAVVIKRSTDTDFLDAIIAGALTYGVTVAALTADACLVAWKAADRRLVWTSVDGPVSAAGDAIPTTLRQAIQASRESADTKEAVVLLLSRSDSVVEQAPQAGAIDVDTCLDRAFSQGIPISAETLQAIYDLEKRTWAPSSARSRAQAGFQAPTGATA